MKARFFITSMLGVLMFMACEKQNEDMDAAFTHDLFNKTFHITKGFYYSPIQNKWIDDRPIGAGHRDLGFKVEGDKCLVYCYVYYEGPYTDTENVTAACDMVYDNESRRIDIFRADDKRFGFDMSLVPIYYKDGEVIFSYDRISGYDGEVRQYRLEGYFDDTPIW
ncbi:MAG: hypothetical protein J6V19_07490 [Alistipes sp.]|nr:hypothetical protein [Alistipes sp.]